MTLGGGAYWIIGGLLVAAAEMLAPGFFLLWVGVAALLTGLLAEAAGWALHAQLLAFVVLVVGLVGWAGWRARRRLTVDTVNAPAAGLIGRTCRAVAFAHGEGRVALGDGMWSARLTQPAPVAPGAALTVVGLDGTTLLVTPKP